LRSFFRWLVDDGVIEKNPAEGVRFLNARKLSTTVGFSDEEVRRVLQVPNLHTRSGLPGLPARLSMWALTANGAEAENRSHQAASFFSAK